MAELVLKILFAKKAEKFLQTDHQMLWRMLQLSLQLKLVAGF